MSGGWMGSKRTFWRPFLFTSSGNWLPPKSSASWYTCPLYLGAETRGSGDGVNYMLCYIYLRFTTFICNTYWYHECLTLHLRYGLISNGCPRWRSLKFVVPFALNMPLGRFTQTGICWSWMGHISFWLMLMMLIYWWKRMYYKKNHRSILSAGKEIDLEVNAEKTENMLCLMNRMEDNITT